MNDLEKARAEVALTETRRLSKLLGLDRDPFGGEPVLKVLEKIEERLTKLEAAQAADMTKPGEPWPTKSATRTIKVKIDTTEVMTKVAELREALAGLTVQTVEKDGDPS